MWQSRPPPAAAACVSDGEAKVCGDRSPLQHGRAEDGEDMDMDGGGRQGGPGRARSRVFGGRSALDEWRLRACSREPWLDEAWCGLVRAGVGRFSSATSMLVSWYGAFSSSVNAGVVCGVGQGSHGRRPTCPTPTARPHSSSTHVQHNTHSTHIRRRPCQYPCFRCCYPHPVNAPSPPALSFTPPAMRPLVLRSRAPAASG